MSFNTIVDKILNEIETGAKHQSNLEESLGYNSLIEETERGLIGNSSYDNLLEELDELEEQNIIKLDRKTKIKRNIVKESILLAKSKNDPLFIKYKKAALAKRKFGMAIFKRYGSAARSLANR